MNNVRRPPALALAVVGIVLAAIVAAVKPADTVTLLAWATICVGSAAAALVL